MTAKHTPGPWWLIGSRVYSGGGGGGSRARVKIAVVEGAFSDNPNAGIIACAPEMFDVLRALVADYTETQVQFWGLPTQIRNSTIETAKNILEKLE